MRILSKSVIAAALAMSFAHLALADDIKLGMVIGTTGPFAGGEAPLVNGTKMAVEDINAKGGIKGSKIQLIIEDTGSEQTGAINAYNRILDQEPAAIMNTTVSGFVLSQMGTIGDEGIPTLTGAASAQLALDKKGVEPLFRVRTSDLYVAKAAARFAIDNLGGKKIAVLRANSEFGNSWLNQIQSVLTEKSVKPVAVESFEVADRDFTPQLLRIKDASADVVIVSGDPPHFVVAVQQLKQLGLTSKVVFSNAGVLPTTIKLYQGDSANGIYGTVDSVPAIDPAQADWAKRYREKFNIDSDYSAAEYYDGVMMVAAAIAKVGTDHEALVKEMRSIKDYAGIGNTYSYADKGDGGRSVAIVQIDGGKLKLAATIK